MADMDTESGEGARSFKEARDLCRETKQLTPSSLTTVQRVNSPGVSSVCVPRSPHSSPHSFLSLGESEQRQCTCAYLRG